MTRLARLSLVVAVVAGCATTGELRYYTLDMSPSGQARPEYNLDLTRLHAAQALARSNILIKKTSTEIEYYAVDHWAAGVADLVREKLESEFGEPERDRDVILISGVVLAFEQVDVDGGATAHIKLELEFRRANEGRTGDPLMKRTYEANLPAGTMEAGSVVRALSQGLEEVAVRIAEDTSAL